MKIPHLPAFLGASRVVFRPGLGRAADVIVGWGEKATAKKARAYARQAGLPYLRLEDAFLRSVGLGASGEPPLSIVVDDLGIYYDATRPSRLERTLAEREPNDAIEAPEVRERARRAMERIRRAGLSKYNHAPRLDLGPRERARILVVDQTAGDLSLRLGLAPPGGVAVALEAALDEHPDAEILLKTHPDVAAGYRRGLGDRSLPGRVRLLSEPAEPQALLAQVDHVYTLTSLFGFEALIAGRPVTCFGVPFYAGWGLTDDRGPVPARRRRHRSLEEVVAAAYFEYARYVDPETGTRCEAERVIEHLALQRDIGERNRGRLVCVGFSAWKRGFVPSFLGGPGAELRFVKRDADAERELSPDARIVVWGRRERPELERLARERGVPLWRMEDGFLRSVGLGSDLFAPASLVVDREGIYFDPKTPSELERILAESTFDESQRARARALREQIVSQGLSKYNVGQRWSLGAPDERPLVLVVGQVEGDASIEHGTIDVRDNGALLEAARAARPDAFLVYKPHPDVVSGNRPDALSLERARAIADEVVVDASLSDCLAAASEVHTMTSLVGFEALLRGLPVVVYGQPFYAGWGLTEDRHPHPRRERRLDLDELVYGTLIAYPRYISGVTGRFTTPETIVHELLEARAAGPPSRLARSWPARQLRKLRNLARGATNVR